MIEGEENCTKKRRRLFIRVGLKLRLNVDDECGADSRE